MIKYCIATILLVACSSTGVSSKSEPVFAPVPDPLPVIVMPEIDVRDVRIVEKPKHIKRAARPVECEESQEYTREEFMNKLDCVKKLTEKGGA